MSDANGVKRAESADSGETWTVGRLLTWTTDYLKRRGSESPRLDAEVLLAHALDWSRVKLYTHYEDLVDEAKRASYRDLIRRRAEGAPVAYLVGHKEFYSLSLKVSPAVLIPRPDSEFVVAEARRRRNPADGTPWPQADRPPPPHPSPGAPTAASWSRRGLPWRPAWPVRCTSPRWTAPSSARSCVAFTCRPTRWVDGEGRWTSRGRVGK